MSFHNQIDFFLIEFILCSMHPYVVLRKSFRAIRSTLRTALLNHSAATYQTPRPGSERLAQCEPASWEEIFFPVHLLRHAEKENITEIKQIWGLVPGVPPYLLTFHSFAKQNDCQSEAPADKSLWIATVGRDFNVQISFFFLPTIASAPGGYGMMSVFSSPPHTPFHPPFSFKYVWRRKGSHLPKNRPQP